MVAIQRISCSDSSYKSQTVFVTTNLIYSICAPYLQNEFFKDIFSKKELSDAKPEKNKHSIPPDR